MGTISDRDRAVVLHSLATLVAAGVGLIRSLEVLAEQSANRRVGRICREMGDTLREGKPLSRAMAAHPEVFSPVHRSLTKVAEQTGALVEILRQLSDWEQRRWVLAARIKNALVIPLAVSGSCVLLVAVLPPLVLDSLLKMVSDSAVALPWNTRLLILASTLLRSPWTYAFGAVGLMGLGVALRQFARRPRGRLALARALFAIPVLGRVCRWAALARVSRVLDLCLETGVPLLLALEMAGEVCCDAELEYGVEVAIERVRQGASLATALEGSAFPEVFLQSAQVGEESGDLPAMLRSLAYLFELNLEAGLVRLTAAMEPVVLMSVGSAVGFTLVAALAPLGRVLEAL